METTSVQGSCGRLHFQRTAFTCRVYNVCQLRSRSDREGGLPTYEQSKSCQRRMMTLRGVESKINAIDASKLANRFDVMLIG